jgi:hypothetical protein
MKRAHDSQHEAERPAKDRFVIAGDDGFSEFWRRDKSPVEPLELAKLLTSLRKVAAHVGRNVGEIVWSGMEVDNAIAIDPSPIMGTYPVPAAKADLMVGITIEEAFKKIEWSARVYDLVKEKLAIPPKYEYKFDIFFRTCEDVYVDCLSNRSVFGHYTDIARDWRIHKNARELISPPTVSELMHLWWKLAADRDESVYKSGYKDRSVGGLVERGNLERLYKKPIDVLNTIVDRLRNVCPDIVGTAERCQYRVDLYAEFWPHLLQFIRFWPGDRGDRSLVPDVCDEDMAQEDEERKAVKATIVSYGQLIERAIPNKRRDFSDEIKDNVSEPDNAVAIEGSDIVMVARNKIDPVLLRRLEQVVRQAAQRQSVYNRGLKSGKIHRRSLFRAHTTGTVFQQKEHEFELRNDIVLLIDATGSMADPTKWHKTEIIYQTLYTAVAAFNTNARIFGYNEVKQTCRITELYRGGRMLTILPHGQTASGEAIIATAISTRSNTRRRLIIHITDGASNWGCGVADALTYCKKHGVSLLTLGIGCSPSSKTSLRDEYGKLVQFLEDVDDLPRMLGTLLNYQKRGAA